MSHEDDFYAFYQALEQGHVPQDVIVASTTLYQTPMWLISKVWPSLPGPRVMARVGRQTKRWQDDLISLRHQPTLPMLRRRFLAQLLRDGCPEGNWSWDFSNHVARSLDLRVPTTMDMTRYRRAFVPLFLQQINPEQAGLAAFCKPLHRITFALPASRHARLSLLAESF